jgi:HEAT repeat protein
MRLRCAASIDHRARVLPVMLAVFAAACATPKDPRVVKAEQTLARLTSQDPQYTQYALEIAGRSTAPATGRLITDNLVVTDYQLVYAAATAAARRPVPAFQEPLKTVFSSKGGAAKIEAAVALAKLGDAEAETWLEQHVKDASGTINAAVIRYLVQKGKADLVRPALEQALGSDQQEIRNEAYELLGEIHEPWALSLVQRGFDREHGEGRQAAIVALGESGDPSMAKRIERFINTQGLVFVTIDALGNLGNTAAVPAIQKMLSRSEKPVKVYAAIALWKLGKVDTVRKTIDALLTDEDPKVRELLAQQLATVKEEQALSMLATLAEDRDPDVRLAAARALRERAQEGLEAILTDRLEDSSYQVAAVALDALAAVGSRHALDAIAPLLDNGNPYVAISAANAILEIVSREPEPSSTGQ